MPLVSMERMLEATRLTRAGRLMEATALLRGQEPTTSQPDMAPPGSPVIDMVPPLTPDGSWSVQRAHHSDQTPPAGKGSFKAHIYRGPEGARAYKLYVPAGEPGSSRPLIVMLHGCTQSPDDFATGTGMNQLADQHGMLIAYPAQSQSANAQKCWNWFQAKDQKRAGGEPAIIAAITRRIVDEYAVDKDRVYIAGLSAGGAAAAVMGEVYPDIFAAVGVHSGLACGAARDMTTAFTAMRAGGNDLPTRSPERGARFVPTILFHGDRDATVHPVNGEQVLAQSRAASERLAAEQTSGTAPGGLRYTVTVEVNIQGQPVLEHWLVHGAGHAWSGGSAAGSYTEPRGPDASREMVRFFLANARNRTGQS
ncbi:MAG: alpha/beta hydrolase family esterase [Pannonibacter indicus]